jgi:luciferase-type oxidoreductase
MWISRSMSDPAFGRGYHSVFAKDRLTLGVNFPIESYAASPVPLMKEQMALAKRVEDAGFAALWSRDVPLLDPSFGDAGQIFDPWVWLGYVTAHTDTIALGTGAIILPLRKGVDLAKAAASVDKLSGGRLIMGVASGDRPVEYSVYKTEFETRGAAFRDTLEFIRSATTAPTDWSDQDAARSGELHILPKASAGKIPFLVTGNSRQSPDWIAENADGWLMYPRPIDQQRGVLKEWHEQLKAAEQPWKPFAQSLYIDLTVDPNEPPRPIHLGYRLGRHALLDHLRASQDIGVNHITFNIRFSSRPVEDVIDELATEVVPQFPKMTTGPSQRPID